MMIAKYLWALGSIIMVALGILHLYYTFFTNVFSSRNEKMIEEMQSSSPILSQEINMWKAWIGFNGSHSSGVIFIGIINLYLALRYFKVLQADHFFFIFTIIIIGYYVWLAEKYWFNIAFVGLLITMACFVTSYVLTMINK